MKPGRVSKTFGPPRTILRSLLMIGAIVGVTFAVFDSLEATRGVGTWTGSKAAPEPIQVIANLGHWAGSWWHWFVGLALGAFLVDRILLWGAVRTGMLVRAWACSLASLSTHWLTAALTWIAVVSLRLTIETLGPGITSDPSSMSRWIVIVALMMTASVPLGIVVALVAWVRCRWWFFPWVTSRRRRARVVAVLTPSLGVLGTVGVTLLGLI